MSSSNAPSSLPLSKGTGVPSLITSPSQSQAPAGTAVDRQRRSGTSSGINTGRGVMASARNNQSFRKQNKSSRRPKLGAEDTSEAAAMRSMSSRKGQTSITHLMNFTLPPRPQNHTSHSYGSRTLAANRRNHNWGYNTMDKARFVDLHQRSH
jgi:hypothetical protein